MTSNGNTAQKHLVIKIFYKVCDKQKRTILAIYDNKEQARQHANKNENYFVAVGWDY